MLVSCKYGIININVKMTDIMYIYFAQVTFTRDEVHCHIGIYDTYLSASNVMIYCSPYSGSKKPEGIYTTVYS